MKGLKSLITMVRQFDNQALAQREIFCGEERAKGVKGAERRGGSFGLGWLVYLTGDQGIWMGAAKLNPEDTRDLMVIYLKETVCCLEYRGY